LRRVNQAIYLITRGCRDSALRTIKSLSEILAEEILAAAKGSGSGANSFAVRKKDEIERVAKGNR
jgi:small subunit ribosomal protein S5e